MEKNKSVQLLKIISESGMPVGASFLSNKLQLPPASVGRLLYSLESQGYLQKISNKGRLLTEKGIRYLNQQEQFYNKITVAHNIIESVESPTKQKLFEILEIRIALEPISVSHACIYANSEDIAELHQILLAHRYDLQHGGIGNEQDLKFGRKVG